MAKVIKHVEYGNLIRAHYTKDGDREGTDSGSVAFARGDINLPAVGATFKVPDNKAPDQPQTEVTRRENSAEAVVPVKLAPQTQVTGTGIVGQPGMPSGTILESSDISQGQGSIG
jgi:hypothetical protein